MALADLHSKILDVCPHLSPIFFLTTCQWSCERISQVSTIPSGEGDGIPSTNQVPFFVCLVLGLFWGVSGVGMLGPRSLGGMGMPGTIHWGGNRWKLTSCMHI